VDEDGRGLVAFVVRKAAAAAIITAPAVIVHRDIIAEKHI
jgi:hypothetical protein